MSQTHEQQSTLPFDDITLTELRDKLLQLSGDADEIDVAYLLHNYRQTHPNFTEFDTENWENGEQDVSHADSLLGPYTSKNGMTCWGLLAGGDWEEPVYFIAYSHNGQICLHVPTIVPYNQKTNAAFGNDAEEDYIFFKGTFPDYDLSDEDPEDFMASDHLDLFNYSKENVCRYIDEKFKNT